MPNKWKESREKWRCSLLPQSMDSNNNDQNYSFFIGQIYKISILQVAVSNEDSCNQDSKAFPPRSPMPSSYDHYIHYLTNTIKRAHNPFHHTHTFPWYFLSVFAYLSVMMLNSLFESIRSRYITLSLDINMNWTSVVKVQQFTG